MLLKKTWSKSCVAWPGAALGFLVRAAQALGVAVALPLLGKLRGMCSNRKAWKWGSFPFHRAPHHTALPAGSSAQGMVQRFNAGNPFIAAVRVPIRVANPIDIDVSARPDVLKEQNSVRVPDKHELPIGPSDHLLEQGPLQGPLQNGHLLLLRGPPALLGYPRNSRMNPKNGIDSD